MVGEQRGSATGNLAGSLFLLAVAAYMLLSADMLSALGIPYDTPNGPPVAKLHPGTYCLLLAWLVALFAHGNPLRVLGRELLKHRLLACYFFCMLLVLAWVVYRHGISGAAFIVEALCTPALAAFVLYLLDRYWQRQVVQLMLLLLLANALVAVAEMLLHARLVPFRSEIADSVVAPYFRSSALLGHPLQNALITISLLPALTLVPWPIVLRVLAAAFLAFSILTYGGRASLLFGGLVYGVLASLSGFVRLVRGQFSYLQLTGGSLLAMLGLTALSGVVAVTGIGARIFDNMKIDSSANVRLHVWKAFDFLSPSDVWMGISPAEIDHVSLRIGLDPVYEAIENFWIYLFMQFGIIGFVPFLLGLACLLVRLWQAATPPMRAAILVYFLVASAANTLASKTASLMLLSLMILASAVVRKASQTNGQQ
jgi:O-antigen ligase